MRGAAGARSKDLEINILIFGAALTTDRRPAATSCLGELAEQLGFTIDGEITVDDLHSQIARASLRPPKQPVWQDRTPAYSLCLFVKLPTPTREESVATYGRRVQQRPRPGAATTAV